MKKGSIRVEVDVEELDLEEIDYERLKLKKISFVLEEQVSAMKDFKGKRGLDLEGSIIWVYMEEVDLEEADYEGLKQKISLVLKERIITFEGAESKGVTSKSNSSERATGEMLSHVCRIPREDGEKYLLVVG